MKETRRWKYGETMDGRKWQNALLLRDVSIKSEYAASEQTTNGIRIEYECEMSMHTETNAANGEWNAGSEEAREREKEMGKKSLLLLLIYQLSMVFTSPNAILRIRFYNCILAFSEYIKR